MTRAVLILVALGLSACATLQSAEPSRCAGPRRPANPHGSVLTAEPPPPPASAAAAGQCGGAPR